MPIRTTAAIALTLAACAAPIESQPESQPDASTVEQPVINTCNPVVFPCLPTDPVASRWCQQICDPEGTQGYCLEYTSVELAWCQLHPDRLFGSHPTRYCDLNGNPTWYTHCEPGWLP